MAILSKEKAKKLKPGDKVKVRKDLSFDISYKCNVGVATEMMNYANRIVTIARAYSPDNIKIIEDKGEWNWGYDFFEEVSELDEKTALIEELTQTIKNNNETSNAVIKDLVLNFTQNVNTINKSIEKISNNLNARTIYDEEIINSIKERVSKMPDKDVQETIQREVQNYIKKNYGSIPKKIEIKMGNEHKELTGLFHKKFEEILKIIERGVPLMLTGPAGAGKNHTLEQVAEALDLDFYFTNAVTQEYKLTGFIDANGVYQETQFYKAFKDGGLFFLDEVDASCPEALIILNSAIANGYFDFPNGKVSVNENFRVACAGNTYGTGADMVYVGRNVLDGATLDRFVTIDFNYDDEIEKQLAYDDELYRFIKDLRRAINDSSLRYIVSMRAIINASKLLEIDMDKKDILKNVIIKNMQIDDLNIIIKKLDMHNSWANLLKDYISVRSI